LNDEKFVKELESGKFTVLVKFLFLLLTHAIIKLSRSSIYFKPFLKNSPVFALFTVKLHSTTSHELSTLQSLIYQLDAVLEKYFIKTK
jgi:hypothetical protein